MTSFGNPVEGSFNQRKSIQTLMYEVIDRLISPQFVATSLVWSGRPQKGMNKARLCEFPNFIAWLHEIINGLAGGGNSLSLKALQSFLQRSICKHARERMLKNKNQRRATGRVTHSKSKKKKVGQPQAKGKCLTCSQYF